QAIARMNVVRADAGLPPLDNPNTRDGVLDYLLEERFATLFLEGQRANDLYRFNLFPQVIGTGFNTKFPMTNGEIQNNSNIEQIRSCPKVS
ncbi:MAG: RagB/SusD family nutrient uptake outer membrane protein, partial [Longimicrobiales bacterium]